MTAPSLDSFPVVAPTDSLPVMAPTDSLLVVAPTDFLLLATVLLVALAAVVGYRVVVGPALQDRVIAVNALGTTTVVILALLAAAFDDPGLLDVALVYGLLNFLLSVGLARVLAEREGIGASAEGVPDDAS